MSIILSYIIYVSLIVPYYIVMPVNEGSYWLRNKIANVSNKHEQLLMTYKFNKLMKRK